MNSDLANGHAVELSPRAKLEILSAILLALFLFALDQTVVGTALPRIVTDLRGDSPYGQTGRASRCETGGQREGASGSVQDVEVIARHSVGQ